MIDPQDTPATPTAEALFMAEERAKIACLMAGTGAMRKAGTKYLPKAPAESPEAYDYRIAVSTLYNGMRRTVETLAGKPFSEPIKLAENVPAPIVEWCDDVDLQGRDLHAFAHAVFVSALADGISHVLVEYPTTKPGATLAQKKATGARPYFLHIKHDQILGWRSERINGVETLTQLRIMEAVTEPAGVWLNKSVLQVRVLEPTKWATYRKNEKGEWIVHKEGAVTLGAVPLATVYSDRHGYMQARPPLLDLADLNIKHWQQESDQDGYLNKQSKPILYASGFAQGSTLIIGPNSAVCNDDPTAKLSYVEPTGAGLQFGRECLKDLEERMSLMGAQLLVKKPGARTATEKAIDSADADSALSLMVRNLEDSIERALQFMADWENLGAAGEVELVGEIGGLEDMEIAGLMKARQLGLLSAETVFNEMQRRGLISDDMEWADELARLMAEGPPIAIGGSFESPDLNGMGGQPGDASTAAVLGGKPKPAGSSGGAAVVHPPADFGPLIASIGSLVDALGKPEAPEPAAPIDFGPLVEAINGRAQPEPAAPLDLTGVVDAMREQAAAIAAMPAPIVNFQAGDVNIAPPAITVEGAQITNTPPAVTVEGSTINVQPAQVVQAKASAVDFTLDANGDITGAKLN